MSVKDLKDIGIDTPEYELYANDDQEAGIDTPDIDNMTPEDFDTYIGAEVDLPLYGKQRQGKVTARAWDSAGKLFGKANSNLILDMRIYQVEFLDGSMAEYSANMIAENIFHRVICQVTSLF